MAEDNQPTVSKDMPKTAKPEAKPQNPPPCDQAEHIDMAAGKSFRVKGAAG